MADSKGSSNIKSVMYNGKHALLPPKIPLSCVSPSYVDYLPGHAIGSKAVQKPKDAKSHHQRTFSETFVIEEQPSWLDDLLNEPETPIRSGGHRRSSSDSFAYMDVANTSIVDCLATDEYGTRISMPMWGPQDFDYQKDAWQPSFYADAKMTDPKSRIWNSSLKTTSHPYVNSSSRETPVSRSPVSSSVPQEADALPSSVSEKKDRVDSGQHDPKASLDDVQSKSSAADNDTKRAKQQFAQRSRVRKLQYIAELERNVQALQVEGSEFSAQLEFVNQQNLILTMEKKALEQRVESLAQEHLIKCLEHEVLDREIGRLRALYQQQLQHQHQPQPQSSSGHRRSKSRDLESQFSNLSLKQKTANSGRDPVTGPLRT